MGRAIELRKLSTGRRPCSVCGKATLAGGDRSRADAGPGVVEDPGTPRNNMHENRETSLAPAPAGRSGKAQGHKPDMHAGEESDCAVVPVKRPNKAEQSAAEVVEGENRDRLRVFQFFGRKTSG